jgi:hypothetical protein
MYEMTANTFEKLLADPVRVIKFKGLVNWNQHQNKQKS